MKLIFCFLFKILLGSITKDNCKCILKFQRNYLKEISSRFTFFFPWDVINNQHRLLRKKIRQLSLPKMQTLKLVSQCVVFLAVKLNLLFTESACTYILLDKNSLFYLFTFLFSYLLDSAPDHNIFIYQFSKTPSSRFRKKNPKTHIPAPHNPHDALCKVRDVLSYESWPPYSTAAQSFSSEVWTYWKN